MPSHVPGHCDGEHEIIDPWGGRHFMVVDKDAVTETLRAQGDHDRALVAETALSRTVDLDRDAGTLHQLGLSVADVQQAATDSADEDAAEN